MWATAREHFPKLVKMTPAHNNLAAFSSGYHLSHGALKSLYHYGFLNEMIDFSAVPKMTKTVEPDSKMHSRARET